jgi:SPP1 family phage portal protein
MMFSGCRYYNGEHDILRRKRTVIGEGGTVTAVDNLPNNHIIDNQYKKAVIQKVNYLLGQPFVVRTDNKAYGDSLNEIFNKDFMRLLKNVYKDSLNCGIGWVFVNYDENGELTFTRLRPYECIPIWHDTEHTKLDCFIRFYPTIDYKGKTEREQWKAEVYDKDGVTYYNLDGGCLKPDKDREPCGYFQRNGVSYNWADIPVVAFKYNDDELPLIRRVKSLQDGLNLLLSNFQNNMEEDVRNTILVLKNYDGENLGEFRRNLATYGAVKVRTVDGSDGGVETLNIEVNSGNYQAIIELLKKAIIENAMCYDAKDDRLGGNANQMNIQSMYSDIDLDANETETEFQAAFEKIIDFVNIHIAMTGGGNYDGEDVEVIFNRDILINEGEAIDNCQKSLGILSTETVIAQHPWVDDVQKELKRLEKQNESDDYGDFGNNHKEPEDDEEDEPEGDENGDKKR